ncbi:hypothetical protein KCU67_g8565, partial [Aureobasidium melanogenum]
MSEQTPHALTIPEVLREVFQYLESDRKALYSASRVNRTWAEECLNVLWHHITVNGAKLLASIPTQRRQFYADKIRCWTLDMSSTDHQDEICDLDFPRLRRVDLWLTKDNWRYDHQLVPTLEDFRLHDTSKKAEYILWELPDCCPNLRKLCVRSDQLDFDGLEGYLKEFSKLRALDLTELRLDLVSSDTNHKSFQAIGTLTELRELHLKLAYQPEKILSREEVLAIGQLHKLRDVEILGGSLIFDELVTDDDLVIFFSSFPEVENIYVDAFNTNIIPSPAMIALATTSTRLRHYVFKAILDVDFAESSTPPLFPELRSMQYQHLLYWDISVEG